MFGVATPLVPPSTQWTMSEMHRVLNQAEANLYGGSGGGSTATNRPGGPTSAAQQPPPASSGVLFAATPVEYRDHHQQALPRSLVSMEPPESNAYLGYRDYQQHPHHSTFGDRQLIAVMNEVRELRHELSLEREARSAVMMSFAKRLKEEVLGDVRSSEHHLQRSLREMEAEWSQRLTEQDNARTVLKRSVDDAVRLFKLQDRGGYDALDSIRLELEDMRNRVDQSVTTSQQMRSEMARKFEQETAAHAHRLDVELLRYADMQRESSKLLAETRKGVADEVAQVSRHVQELVESCWERRLQTLQRGLNDSLETFRRQQEKQSQQVADIHTKTTQIARDMRNETTTTTQDLRDRLVAVEGTLPLLATRVDRFERKADAVFETTNRVEAQFEVLQQGCERVNVQAMKSVERVQKLEDATAERDERVLRCESQLVNLAGLDRLRADLEGVRRGLSRLEGMMDNVKQVADRDERLVETMQRNIDASLERADAVEKKAHRVVARVETSEQRLTGFLDRIIALEDHGERVATSAEQTASTQSVLDQRLSAAEQRLRQLADKYEAVTKDTLERLHGVELRADAAHDVSHGSASKYEAALQASRKDVERLEKRLGKCEATSLNIADNARETRDVADAVAREHAQLLKKWEQWREMLDRKATLAETKASEFDASGQALSERLARHDKRTAASLESLEKRLEDRLELLSRRSDELQAVMSKRATQDAVARSAMTGGGAAVGGASIVDETLAVEVGAARRRLDAVELRLRQLEARTSVHDEDTVQRHELQALRTQVTSTENRLQAAMQTLEVSLRAAMTITPAAAAGVVQATNPQQSQPLPSSSPSSPPVRRSASTVEVIVPLDATRKPQPQQEQQQQQLVPPPTTASTALQPPSWLASDGRMSSVSSLHDEPIAPASTLQVSSRATTQQLQPQLTPSVGLPPLGSSTTVTGVPRAATAAATGSGLQRNLRNPYSDTSESEAEGRLRASNLFGPPQALSSRSSGNPPPTSGAPPANKKPQNNFDDDDDDDGGASGSAAQPQQVGRAPPPPALSSAALRNATPSAAPLYTAAVSSFADEGGVEEADFDIDELADSSSVHQQPVATQQHQTTRPTTTSSAAAAGNSSAVLASSGTFVIDDDVGNVSSLLASTKQHLGNTVDDRMTTTMKPNTKGANDFDDDDDDDPAASSHNSSIPLIASPSQQQQQQQQPQSTKVATPSASVAAAAATNYATTDDDLAIPLSAGFGRRRSAAAGRTFAAAIDTSTSAAEETTGAAASHAAASLDTDQPSSTRAKKYHKPSTTNRSSSQFDDDDDDDDDDDGSQQQRSASGSPSAASGRRSAASSRRSGQSRRTTDVSLSLGSSRKGKSATNTHQSSRRRGGGLDDDEDAIDDDDTLAEMLGFMDSKRRK